MNETQTKSFEMKMRINKRGRTPFEAQQANKKEELMLSSALEIESFLLKMFKRLD